MRCFSSSPQPSQCPPWVGGTTLPRKSVRVARLLYSQLLSAAPPIAYDVLLMETPSETSARCMWKRVARAFVIPRHGPRARPRQATARSRWLRLARQGQGGVTSSLWHRGGTASGTGAVVNRSSQGRTRRQARSFHCPPVSSSGFGVESPKTSLPSGEIEVLPRRPCLLSSV